MVLRNALTVVAVKLLTMPYLQIVGGLLLSISVQLPSDQDGHADEETTHGSLLAAIRTI